ncbi:cytochrome P450 monooxygenase pc-3 [Macrolepiota fuliginosa MF-IS2]|uniref:Cytochrome P450 monooxygenase pc-3 n=1 Tax=Macrolepiota fuliginosa MF-IS2 TaxID=1400762 RepID=A0A9P6C0Z0_9AGAR|nr:cytochrome P450 monooxygenase pc-3 [Macrolepiota fuliginosa MF-IS2]
MIVSPGLDFIGRAVAQLVLPCIIAYGTLTVACNLLTLEAPRWALVLFSVIPRLLYFFLGPSLEDRRNSRDAKAHGAALPPHIDVKPFETSRRIIENFKAGYPAELFLEWTQKFGQTFRFTVGLDQRVFTTEPDHVKVILATQFETFVKGPSVFTQFKSLLGTGVFNSDGEMWKFHRSITRPFFSKERIGDFEIFDRHAEDALRQAKSRLAEGYPIDFQDLVSRFTLDSATEFLFKNDVLSLSAGLPYPDQPSPFAKANSLTFENHPSNAFVKAFVSGQDVVTLRGRSGTFWPLKEIWGDVVAPLRKEVDRFVEPFVKEGMKRKQEKVEGKTGETETLLDYLVDQTQDREVIKDELVNLLVASRDTTASLLTFSLYMLIEHPDITRRLRTEILSTVGPKSMPTYDDIRSMKYLRAFLNEVLRLYPAVPVNSRTATKPVVLAPTAGSDNPIYIPTGTRVIYSVFLMQRRTDLWGPDALEFDPDRWLDERLQKYLIKNPCIFLPFNAGPRICLGQQFAYNESSFFLIRLLQHFSSFSLASDAQPPNSLPPKEWAGKEGPQGRDKILPASHLTMYVKGGLWVRMNEMKEFD